MSTQVEIYEQANGTYPVTATRTIDRTWTTDEEVEVMESDNFDEEINY